MDLHQQRMSPLHSKSDPHSSQFFVFANGEARNDRVLHKKATQRMADSIGYFRTTLIERRRLTGEIA